MRGALVLQIESWGYQTMPVSAASGKGLEQLNAVLKDRVSVVAGPSGTPPEWGVYDGPDLFFHMMSVFKMSIHGSSITFEAVPPLCEDCTLQV